MSRIRLVHWSEVEARERAAMIQSQGHTVTYEALSPSDLRAMREDPPDVVVIDLTRLPAQGRDLGLNLRKHKATRGVPLVFVGGSAQKVALARELLPDAIYTSWAGIGAALQYAIENPPTEPIVPASTMAGYAGTPLPKKLGIKPGSSVALVGAPEDFEETLGQLPDGATVTRQANAASDVTLWFTRSQEDLVTRVKPMVPAAIRGGLWIIWPKKASRAATDLTQAVVRETGLAAGLVDFKVAAIDATWSGLRFTQRKPGTGP
jgi:hypothetical protein